jgi:DNA primase
MTISQDIESRISIVELVSRYVPLKKAGANYKALSPFVQEKSPSFMVSPAKNIAYCFSSRKWGGPIKFLAEIEKIDYREAMQILAKEAGIELKTDFARERDAGKADIYEAHKIAAAWYHDALFATENADKLAYAQRRGLTLDTLKLFGIGYSGDPRGLWNLLLSRGMTDKDILESGIFVSANRDKFFGRIIFPIANFTGNVVGFTGRIIDAWEPKYLNSPASRVFNKSEILYGLHLAKSSITREGYAIIVEGQMDTVKLHQAGFTTAVGISGTALTKEHIRFLSRLTKKIYLCLDSDKAGVNATFSSLDSLLGEEIDCRIIQIGGGKDPDEFIESGGDFKSCIATAISPIQFYIDAGSSRFDLTSFVGKTQILREVLKYVKRMSNRIEADMAIKYLSRALDISESVIGDELGNTKIIRPSTIENKNEGLTFWETLIGYMAAYDFYDLCLGSFDYTSKYFEAIPSFALVRSELTAHAQGVDPVDLDTQKALALQIESENEGVQSAALQIKFKELLKRVHKLMFEREKQELAETLDTNSNEYLSAYSSLLSRGKKLGII